MTDPDTLRGCGWCGTSNPEVLTNCVNCGGPLPLPLAPDPGPPPPPAPRALPTRFVRSRVLGGFGVLWGLMFGGIGGMLAIIFLFMAFVLPPMLLGVLIGGMFFLVGAGAAAVSIYRGLDEIGPLRSGRAVVAEVRRVQLPTVRGEPVVVDYTFSTPEGGTWGGSISTADPRMLGAEPGHHLHVVYMPRDPTRNAPWPPLQPSTI